MAQPPSRLIQNFSDRILKAGQSAELAYHGEIGSVGRPVSPLHIFQHLARSAAAERHSAQRAFIRIRIDVVAVQQNRHLSVG